MGQALAEPRRKAARRIGKRLDDGAFDLLPLTGKPAPNGVVRDHPAHQDGQLRLAQRLFHAGFSQYGNQNAHRRASRHACRTRADQRHAAPAAKRRADDRQHDAHHARKDIHAHRVQQRHLNAAHTRLKPRSRQAHLLRRNAAADAERRQFALQRLHQLIQPRMQLAFQPFAQRIAFKRLGNSPLNVPVQFVNGRHAALAPKPDGFHRAFLRHFKQCVRNRLI